MRMKTGKSCRISGAEFVGQFFSQSAQTACPKLRHVVFFSLAFARSYDAEPLLCQSKAGEKRAKAKQQIVPAEDLTYPSAE